MAKKINEVIEDRIDDGLDAWRIKLKLAATSPHEEVRAQAEVAGDRLTVAVEALQGIDTILGRINDVEARDRNEDPRQEKLIPEERCKDCEHAGPETEGFSDFHCDQIGSDVEGDTPAADQECGCFTPRETEE